MAQNKHRWTRKAATVQWLYLGASGVLQPMSEEFLYRSPADPAKNTCRWQRRPGRENDHAAI